ncbi:MAG: glycyl radical protein [Lachnospiraceae bacterium]
MAASERIKKLRDKMVVLPAVCVERALYMTESYEETEHLPAVLRRAHALDHILSNMTVKIDDGELIVGWQTSKQRGGALLIELDANWILEELDTVNDREWDKYAPLEEREKELIKELLPKWKGRSLFEKWSGMMTPDGLKMENIVQNGGYSRNKHHQAHASCDYEQVIKEGLLSCIEDLDRRIEEIDVSIPGEIHRRHFYEAAKISQQAVLKFANRYAELAEELADKESDTKRKKELIEIAEICRRVPAYPARTFQEAVQSMWFVFVSVMIEGWGAGQSIGRCDQYLYPYYEADIKEGRIDRDWAKELMSCVLIRMNGVINLQADFLQVAYSGYPIIQGLCIGGCDDDGNDAVNELTYIILDAEEDVGLTAEDVVVRVNRNNPDKYVMRACEVAKNLRGKMKFVSDETTIASLLDLGIPLKHARRYISTGCHNPGIPGFAQMNSAVIFNFPLMLELALNDGKRRLTGEQIGPHTGNPKEFKSIAEIEEAFRKQFEEMVKYSYLFKNVDMYIYGMYVPVPLCSSLYPVCLERGMDIYGDGFKDGTAPYSTHTTSICGVPNIADSLAALQKCVFEEKRYTMSQVIDVLDNNYEGDLGEEMLYHFSKAPKFGNDDDYVDSIASRVVSFACDTIRKHKTVGGRRSVCSAVGMTINIPYGELMGATPDGRKAGEPLSEGGISPHQGRNISGATATMNSVKKIDQVKLTNGSILNMRLSAASVKDEASLKKFTQLVRTFFDGGNLVQFNFTSNEILRAAQKEPEKYKDLLVRVATYSSYFVELSPPLQENLIARTEAEI